MYLVSGFFPDFSGLSQNLHISVVLTIFLNRMFGLLLKKDIFFQKSIRFLDFSGFFQNLHISVVLTISLDKMFGLLLKNDIFFGNLSGFRIFSGFSKKVYISDVQILFIYFLETHQISPYIFGRIFLY